MWLILMVQVGKYTIPMDPMMYSPAAAPAELGSVWRKIPMTQWLGELPKIQEITKEGKIHVKHLSKY